jgi:RNA polymerase sigma-70 factor (ECF subfamily)
MASDASEDEASLVARAQGGDRGAVEQLLERHLPGLEAYVRLRAGKAFGAREAVSDLVQSTCRDLLTNLDQFKHGGEQAFRHWLYATAARKIADKYAYHHAQRRELGREGVSQAVSQVLFGLAGREPSPTQQVAGNEFLERLQGAFGALNEREREVVLLSRVVGLSRTEVAEAMGESEGAIRNLLHRALAKLAARLGA